MNCEIIDNILRELKVNSAYAIRGKNRAVDKIYAEHLKDVDSQLTDVRIFVAKLSTGYSTTEALKMIDEFIYKKQVS
jgi:hypothetical protein